MSKFLIVVFMFFLLLGVAFAETTIITMGPTTTKSDQNFNLQSDGTSAIWITAKDVTPSTIVVWDNHPLFSVTKVPDLITATVQNNFYRKPGLKEIYLLDIATGRISTNKVVFKID